MRDAFALQKILSFFSTKNIPVFGYKVVKHLTSWPLNELVNLTMPWTTGPWLTLYIASAVGILNQLNTVQILFINSFILFYLIQNLYLSYFLFLIPVYLWIGISQSWSDDTGEFYLNMPFNGVTHSVYSIFEKKQPDT